MVSTLALKLLDKLTDQVIAYALEQSGLGDRVRAWLKKDPPRLAFQTAFLRAYGDLAEQHGDLAASLLDEHFFKSQDVARELARLLTRRDAPDPAVLARTWAGQLPGVGKRYQQDAEAALADFLRRLERELGEQEALRAIYDSRELARIADNIEALSATLREQLAAANRQVRIVGDVHRALIVTGDSNTINYFAAPVRALPTHYAVRVENFLFEYLGRPGQPVPFGGRQAELRQLSQWLEDESAPPYLLLTAPAGRGKSALLARWTAALQTREDVAVVFAPVSIRFNTNLYGVTFAILAAQLARVYGKKPPEKDETPEMWRAFVTETLRESPPDGKQVVVVVDGLDEAADWTPGADLFPARPGQGVRVVVSARLTATHPTPADWLSTLNWRHLGRARSIILEGLSRTGIAEALTSMGFPLDELGRRVDIVAELYRLTEGDPLLVRFYVDDLWARGEAVARLQPEDLRAIEPGYSGYFKDWWQDQRQLWGKDAPLKERSVREVLNLLACALGPLTQEDLLALADESADLDPWSLEEALRPIARFVVGDRAQGYSLAHPKLGEYFREETLRGEVERIQHRFVAWAERVLTQLEAEELAPQRVPRYLLHYASVHLQQAGELEALARLIETPVWYTASREEDPSAHLFAADVGRDLALVERQVKETQRVESLAHVVAWSLLYATVRTLATNVPIEALETMVLLGEADRALRYAALITSPKWQAEAYQRIGLRLHGQGKWDQARETLQMALAAAEDIRDEYDRAETLTEVAQALAQVRDQTDARNALHQALAAAEGIESERSRFEALVKTARALAQIGDQTGTREALQKALTVADGIVDKDSAEALTVVALTLFLAGDQEGARQALHQALAAADDIRDEYDRAEAQVDVALIVAQVGNREDARQALHSALAAAGSIRIGWRRAETLVEMARALAQVGDQAGAREALQKALAAADGIENERRRTRAMAEAAQALALAEDREDARRALHQALAAAEDIRDEYDRVEALVEVALIVAQVGDREDARQALYQALALAEGIESERSRAEALVVVVRALVQVEDQTSARKALRQALAAAESIQDKWHRARAMAEVARALAQVKDRVGAQEAVQRALAAAEGIGDEDVSARALAEVAQALAQVEDRVGAQEAVQRALAAAEGIGDEDVSARALAGVARALALVGDRDGALAAAEGIKSNRSRARALAEVGLALTQAGDREGARKALQEALTAVEGVESDRSRTEALAGVALALAMMGDREGALTAADGIQYEDDRDEAMVGVALAQALMGDREGALTVAEGIENDRNRTEALTGVALALALMGDRKGALTAADNIQYEDDRDEALAGVALVLALMGDQKGTLTATEGIEYADYRTRALAGVAEILALVEDWEDAREALQKALAAADGIERDRNRTEVLTGVALVLALMGDQEGARETLQKALAAAEGIGNDIFGSRPRALTKVAGALALVADAQDKEIAAWTVETFRQARERGSYEAWRHIAAFAPVLAKLGVISETWSRIQAVERVVAGERA